MITSYVRSPLLILRASNSLLTWLISSCMLFIFSIRDFNRLKRFILVIFNSLFNHSNISVITESGSAVCFSSSNWFDLYFFLLACLLIFLHLPSHPQVLLRYNWHTSRILFRWTLTMFIWVMGTEINRRLVQDLCQSGYRVAVFSVCYHYRCHRIQVPIIFLLWFYPLDFGLPKALFLPDFRSFC